MVEVTIDSIRVSLMSQHRVVILKDVDSDRYLPIWIGPCEADAITVTLQELEVSRPLTHDLLKNVIGEKVKSMELSAAEVKVDMDFTGFPAGVYFYRTYKEGTIVETRKVVKAN